MTFLPQGESLPFHPPFHPGSRLLLELWPGVCLWMWGKRGEARRGIGSQILCCFLTCFAETYYYVAAVCVQCGKRREQGKKRRISSSPWTLWVCKGAGSHLTVESNHLVDGKIWQFAGNFNWLGSVFSWKWLRKEKENWLVLSSGVPGSGLALCMCYFFWRPQHTLELLRSSLTFEKPQAQRNQFVRHASK